MSNIFLYLRRYIGVERCFIPSAVCVPPVPQWNAPVLPLPFLPTFLLKPACLVLHPEYRWNIRASLHRIECRRIVKQRALFCGQGMTVRHMVRNDFLDSFRRMRRVDLADSGHCNPFLSRWWMFYPQNMPIYILCQWVFALSIKMLYAILLKHVFSLFSLDDAPPME